MKEYRSLFEQQAYMDALSYYNKVLDGEKMAICWDYVILTASNNVQAEAYRLQIKHRQEIKQLPEKTQFVVLPDPGGKRVGSGGATFNALKYLKTVSGSFKGKRTLIIHSGGDSKRIPQYSACGKLFSPVPRKLPNGNRSTLFDEFMIGMSTVASRMNDGILICSGDVLLIFNALQIDFYTRGAAALSIKENVDTGKNHGVFLKDESSDVSRFLHKQSVETLSGLGAIDKRNNVNIDTGAVIFDSELAESLYSLIDTDDKFDSFVNEKARISFYADFLYPLATESTLEQFYKETPEGDFTEELKNCRTKIWDAISKYNMKLIQLSPASFLHFGTTKELRSLVTEEIGDYRFLEWSGNVNTNNEDESFAASNSYISPEATVEEGCYIEDSYIEKGSHIKKGSVLSGVTLNGQTIPENVVIHGLKLTDGNFTVRMYGVDDNPKENKLFGKTIGEPLWDAKIYPVCDSIEKALLETLRTVYNGEKFDGRCISLHDGFENADITQIIPWQNRLDDIIKSQKILQAIADKVPADVVKERFSGISQRVCDHLEARADKLDETDIFEFGEKIRIYFYLYKITGSNECYAKCFDTIRNAVVIANGGNAKYNPNCKIVEDETVIRLPIRVNFGGGWSDTPPHCLEQGGNVLNAAVSFGDTLPIEITLKKIDKPCIALASTDIGSYKEFTDILELQSCNNPSDTFALHKAVLIACGVIPQNDNVSVSEIVSRLGSGFYLNTRVINIPKGSGLGTSSILTGACVMGLYRFFGIPAKDENELFNRVLCAEQLMSTGGGWQDQVGGMTDGIKFIKNAPGLDLKITYEPLKMSEDMHRELNERLCLIYTGQRRLARNLLREVVGKYIGNDPDCIEVLSEIQKLSIQMKNELEQGSVDGFAKLMNRHWELSKKMDAGCSNLCIEQIFYAIDDLIDGKMICGAGGGGFLQVILKKDVNEDTLNDRLYSIFQDSGVEVRNCRFI